MAGSASRKRSAGHAPASVRGDDHLTIDLDHSMRADQQRHRLRHHQNGGDSSRARENEWTLRYALLSSDLVGWAPPPTREANGGRRQVTVASFSCWLGSRVSRRPCAQVVLPFSSFLWVRVCKWRTRHWMEGVFGQPLGGSKRFVSRPQASARMRP